MDRHLKQAAQSPSCKHLRKTTILRQQPASQLGRKTRAVIKNSCKSKIFYVFLLCFILALALYKNFIPDGLNLAVHGVNENLLPYTIRGASMEPTLKDGEQVNVDADYYKNHNLSRGDIVAFKLKTQEKPFVKRVVALPGDKLEFGNDGNIYINGKKTEEPYLADKNYHFDPQKTRVLLIPLTQTNNTVPQGTFLAFGDNRRSSFDSGYYGFVPVEYIIGKIAR